MVRFFMDQTLQTMYSDLPKNHAANFIPIIGIKFAASLFGRSEYVFRYP